jgi:cytochrome c oxidase cbb3-type subunit 3
MGKPERDEISGVDTTGHEWDGLKELNNPLPRWWVLTLYASCVWAVAYWVLMPAWPLLTDYTKGIRGHSQRAEVMKQVGALQEARAARGAVLVDAELSDIQADPDLLQFAMANGRSAFGDNCSACHGQGAQGFVGFPNLNDDEWLWGGTLDDIQQTILYGIRNEHPDTRFGEMPAYGTDEIFSAEEIRDVASYALSLSGGTGADGADLANGETLFVDNCAACHGDAGMGEPALGAPNLTDNIWLYGGSYETVVETIHAGRAGVMPHFVERLDAPTVKSLAVYVHSLGGGQ